MKNLNELVKNYDTDKGGKHSYTIKYLFVNTFLSG